MVEEVPINIHIRNEVVIAFQAKSETPCMHIKMFRKIH